MLAAQPAITCSNLTKETLEQVLKYVQSWQWRYQNDAGVALVSLLLTLNIFHTLFWCFSCQLWAGKCRLGAVLLSTNFFGLLFFLKMQNIRLCILSTSCLTLTYGRNTKRFNTSSHDCLNLNPSSANPTKWSNTLKQFVGNLPKNCLGVWPFCGIGA